MDKYKLILLLSGGIIFTVGYNLGIVIRDVKVIHAQQQIEQPIYKQIPVIPFTNLQWLDKH